MQNETIQYMVTHFQPIFLGHYVSRIYLGHSCTIAIITTDFIVINPEWIILDESISINWTVNCIAYSIIFINVTIFSCYA